MAVAVELLRVGGRARRLFRGLLDFDLLGAGDVLEVIELDVFAADVALARRGLAAGFEAQYPD